jgi:hypothetical protein
LWRFDDYHDAYDFYNNLDAWEKVQQQKMQN